MGLLPLLTGASCKLLYGDAANRGRHLGASLTGARRRASWVQEPGRFRTAEILIQPGESRKSRWHGRARRLEWHRMRNRARLPTEAT